MATTLAGKIAIVTGGNRGIGLAIARALSSAGAHVAITGRDDSALAAAREDHQFLTLRCDVRDPESVASAFASIRNQFGRIDILVNNAGIAHASATAQELSLKAWNEVIETNLTGLFLVTQAALLLMQSGATIVNNLSMAAKTVYPGMLAYIASKRGALGFTDALREELRPRNIRVIALIPGATSTEIWQQFWPDAPRDRMMSPESVAEALLAALQLPQEATVSELVITPTGGAL